MAEAVGKQWRQESIPDHGSYSPPGFIMPFKIWSRGELRSPGALDQSKCGGPQHWNRDPAPNLPPVVPPLFHPFCLRLCPGPQPILPLPLGLPLFFPFPLQPAPVLPILPSHCSPTPHSLLTDPPTAAPRLENLCRLTRPQGHSREQEILQL